ncbi:MAG: sulfite exporter TauE/SafE family protein [Deltaproteobacteria bacterium]|nr:sulfite exporter TauE/SafE family protein [Deltaproteobacteria bacterium]
MKYLVICLSSFLASGLTLFSGFGLGTILMPVLAMFFPVSSAIALSAVVHLCNNLFKLALLGRHADKTVIYKFGIPAILAAYLGAQALLWLSHLHPLLTYQLLGRSLQVMPLKLVVALLMVGFALMEVAPRLSHLSFDRKYLPLGGVLSGFFGGLSGHQGALRGAFLVRCGLSPESFIGTGVVIACLVDFSRLLVYRGSFLTESVAGERWLLMATILAAFSGAFLGNRLLKKVTMRFIQALVALMLLGIALALGMGLI